MAHDPPFVFKAILQKIEGSPFFSFFFVDCVFRVFQKKTYLVPPGGHISVKNMSSGSQVVQRYRTRAPPSPYTRRQECPKIFPTKKCLVPYQKARLCQGTFEKPRMMPSSCCPRHPPLFPPVFEPKIVKSQGLRGEFGEGARRLNQTYSLSSISPMRGGLPHNY